MKIFVAGTTGAFEPKAVRNAIEAVAPDLVIDQLTWTTTSPMRRVIDASRSDTDETYERHVRKARYGSHDPSAAC